MAVAARHGGCAGQMRLRRGWPERPAASWLDQLAAGPARKRRQSPRRSLHFRHAGGASSCGERFSDRFGHTGLEGKGTMNRSYHILGPLTGHQQDREFPQVVAQHVLL